MYKRSKLEFFRAACFFPIIVLFGVKAYAQEARIVFDSMPSVVPSSIKVFVDSSRSMGGFFSGSVGMAKGVYEWFNHLSNMPSKSRIEYFVFASHPSRLPIREGDSFTDLLAKRSIFNGQDNIYSIAFDTIIEEVGKGDSIGIVLTDGVPSIISRGPIDNQLQNERNRIGNAFKKFLEKSPDNHILIYRFLFPYIGKYYSSDRSFEPDSVHGTRNFYAIVFCENKHIKFVDKIFDSNTFQAYDIKKQSFTDYGNVRIEVCNTSVVNNKITFSLITSSPEIAGNTLKIIKGKETEVPFDKRVEQGKIIVNIKFSKEDIQNRDSFKISFGPKKLDPFFKSLNIESNAERDLVGHENFHNKTFRLSFLTDALENNYNNSFKQHNALTIGFKIESPNNHWQEFFEPLFFGLLPPQPDDEKFYTGATFPLFLLRWLTPIISALLIYLVCFNKNVLDIRNLRTQKTVWTAGLLLNFLLCAGLAFVIISKPEGYYCVPLKLGHYIKYILYDAIFSVLLYFVLSLVLKRRKSSIAQNVPF